MFKLQDVKFGNRDFKGILNDMIIKKKDVIELG